MAGHQNAFCNDQPIDIGRAFNNMISNNSNLIGIIRKKILNISYRPVVLYISTKSCDIISNGIKVIERTRFLY